MQAGSKGRMGQLGTGLMKRIHGMNQTGWNRGKCSRPCSVKLRGWELYNFIRWGAELYAQRSLQWLRGLLHRIFREIVKPRCFLISRPVAILTRKILFRFIAPLPSRSLLGVKSSGLISVIHDKSALLPSCQSAESLSSMTDSALLTSCQSLTGLIEIIF